jgi:acetyltransferase-like isoleucine patch superfamily enzyme
VIFLGSGGNGVNIVFNNRVHMILSHNLILGSGVFLGSRVHMFLSNEIFLGSGVHMVGVSGVRCGLIGVA